jgi:hypothetical protein
MFSQLSLAWLKVRCDAEDLERSTWKKTPLTFPFLIWLSAGDWLGFE